MLGAGNMTDLEKIVREWREAQLVIDCMSVDERRHDDKPLRRLIAAHDAMVKYADKHLIGVN
jgi:hypothetical protein